MKLISLIASLALVGSVAMADKHEKKADKKGADMHDAGHGDAHGHEKAGGEKKKGH